MYFSSSSKGILLKSAISALDILIVLQITTAKKRTNMSREIIGNISTPTISDKLCLMYLNMAFRLFVNSYCFCSLNRFLVHRFDIYTQTLKISNQCYDFFSSYFICRDSAIFTRKVANNSCCNLLRLFF